MSGMGMAGCGIRFQAPLTNGLLHLLLCRGLLLPVLSSFFHGSAGPALPWTGTAWEENQVWVERRSVVWEREY